MEAGLQDPHGAEREAGGETSGPRMYSWRRELRESRAARQDGAAAGRGDLCLDAVAPDPQPPQPRDQPNLHRTSLSSRAETGNRVAAPSVFLGFWRAGDMAD